MAASLNETVLESFCVDAEGLRDLDSIVRQRCQEIDQSAVVEYDILRKDSLRYRTGDIEDLIKERNGNETRIQQVAMNAHTANPDRLKFEVEFDKSLRITGESNDRASLVLLASDVRALIRERMRGRTPMSRRTRSIITSIALVAGLVGYFIFSNVYTNQWSTRIDREYQVSQNLYNRQSHIEMSTYRTMLARYRNLGSHASPNAELAFLVQHDLFQMRDQLAYDQAYAAEPRNTAEPWWGNSNYLLLAAGIILAGAVGAASYIAYPNAGAIFMIGDEVRRQTKKAQRRDRLVWGIGVTFVLGIASAIVASALS